VWRPALNCAGTDSVMILAHPLAQSRALLHKFPSSSSRKKAIAYLAMCASGSARRSMHRSAAASKSGSSCSRKRVSRSRVTCSASRMGNASWCTATPPKINATRNVFAGIAIGRFGQERCEVFADDAVQQRFFHFAALVAERRAGRAVCRSRWIRCRSEHPCMLITSHARCRLRVCVVKLVRPIIASLVPFSDYATLGASMRIAQPNRSAICTRALWIPVPKFPFVA